MVVDIERVPRVPGVVHVVHLARAQAGDIPTGAAAVEEGQRGAGHATGSCACRCPRLEGRGEQMAVANHATLEGGRVALPGHTGRDHPRQVHGDVRRQEQPPGPQTASSRVLVTRTCACTHSPCPTVSDESQSSVMTPKRLPRASGGPEGSNGGSVGHRPGRRSWATGTGGDGAVEGEGDGAAAVSGSIAAMRSTRARVRTSARGAARASGPPRSRPRRTRARWVLGQDPAGKRSRCCLP